MFQFIQTFISTNNKEQDNGQLPSITNSAGLVPKISNNALRKVRQKVITEYQSISSTQEPSKKVKSSSISATTLNQVKIQIKTTRQPGDVPISKIEIFGSKQLSTANGVSEHLNKASLIQRQQKHQSNKQSVQSMSTIAVEEPILINQKRQSLSKVQIIESPAKKYSKKLSPHHQHQAELEDRPMNESLRHTIVIDEDGDQKFMEALDQYKKEIAQKSPEENDHRKTIVLIDGQIPANFGIISSQQMKKMRTENNLMPQILKDYPDTTNESERSSIFAENTMIPEEQMTMKTNYMENPSQTVQKNVASTKGLAFIAGAQNLKLMESLNTPMEKINKIQQYLELNMRMQNLKELQESLFFKNQYIRTVDLRNNLIAQLPEAICELSLLWKLRLDFNVLDQLPDNLGKLQKLEVLTVSNNKLKSLPLSIFQLGDSLNILILNDNNLKRLPNSIGYLKNVKNLLLHNNRLRKLPCDLSQLKDLSEFSSEWFSYVVPQVNKVLKDDRGKLIIKDFQRFCLQIHEIMRKNHSNRSLRRKKKYSFSFMHFVAHFNKLSNFNDLITFKSFSKSRSLLHQLFLNGHLHLLKEYLSCTPFDPSCFSTPLDEDNSTPLLLAIKNKHSSFLEYLIQSSSSFAAYDLDMTLASAKYGPCLHLALKNHDFKLVSLILLRSQRCKVDLRQVDSEGNNLLHVLMGSHFGQGGRESAEIAVRLIKYCNSDDINGLNHAQLTPLHLAIKKFQNKSLKFALDFNLHQLQKNKAVLFDLNLQCGKNDAGQTPLHIAVSNSNLTAVNLLIQYAQIIAQKYDEKYISFFHMRDSEFRLPQEMCPYNSPIAKIMVQCQARLLQIRNKFRNSEIISQPLQVSFSHTVNRRHRNMIKVNNHRSHSQQNLNKLHNGSRVINGSDHINQSYSPFEAYQGKMPRDFSVSIPHQQRTSNLVSSRTERDLNRVNGQQLKRSDLSIISIAKYDSQGNQREPKSEKLHKYSPRILQKMAPLPPKVLIPFKFSDKEQILLRQTCDQMFDMEELTKSMEVVEEDLAQRFMSHQVNFESGQTIQQDELKRQLIFSRHHTYERESISSGISSAESESSEERKSGILSQRCTSDLRSSAIGNFRVGSSQQMMHHNYQSAPHSVKPSLVNSRLGSGRSSKVKEHKNLDDLIEDSNSTVELDLVQRQNLRPVSGMHVLQASYSPNQVSPRHPQKNVQPLLQAIQALKDQSKTPTNDTQLPQQNSQEDEDEDICDAAVDEEEPEAASMGQIIAKRINKFENGQINEAEYRSQSQIEKLIKIVKGMNEVKEERRKRAAKFDEGVFVVNPNYQGLNYQSNQQVTTLLTLEDENTFEAVFDSTKQLFIDKSRQGGHQLMSMSSKSPINSQAIDYLMRDGLNLKNKMKELNKDCFINSENLLREKLQTEVKNLKVIFSDTLLTLSSKYRLLFSFYHSLFQPQQANPSFLSFPAAADLPLSTLLHSNTLPFIVKVDLVNLFRSKLIIPHLEQLMNGLFSSLLQRDDQQEQSKDGSEGVVQHSEYERVWLIGECKNAVGVLTREAMEQSRGQMERCNSRVKIERERSRERMRMKVRGFSANDGHKDRANLSDEKINNETEIVQVGSQISRVKVLNQSASAFSIRQVPEFVARLNKSPSQTSVHREMLRNNSTADNAAQTAPGTLKNESAYSNYTQINVSNFKHQAKFSPFHQYWQQSNNSSNSSKLLFNVNSQTKYPPLSAMIKKSQTPKEAIPSSSTSIGQAFHKYSDHRKYYLQQSSTPMTIDQDASNNNSASQINTSRNTTMNIMQPSSSAFSLKIKQAPRSTRSPQPPQSLNHSNFIYPPLPTTSNESDTNNSLGRRTSPHFPGTAIPTTVILQADLNYPIVITQQPKKMAVNSSNVTVRQHQHHQQQQQKQFGDADSRRQMTLIQKKLANNKNSAANKKR